MNITAALVTGATVTVYFVGLVHFQNVTNGTGGDVIVPLATATGQMQNTTTLVPHRADIEVIGAGPQSTAWPTDWSYVPANTTTTPPKPAVLTIKGLSRSEVVLPVTSSTTTFTTDSSFGSVPKLASLCARTTTAMGTLNNEYASGGNMVAIRTRLSKGKLTAAPDINQWITTLTIDEASNTLTIKTAGKEIPVALVDGAAIKIINEPINTASRSDKGHFWWFYKMYSAAGDCEGLPAVTTTDTAGHHPYMTGVGCSNSQYP